MEAKINGITITGTVDEVRELITKSARKKQTTSKDIAPNNFKQWTAQEDKYVMDNYPRQGHTHEKKGKVAHISSYLGRTRKSVCQRFGNLSKEKVK